MFDLAKLRIGVEIEFDVGEKHDLEFIYYDLKQAGLAQENLDFFITSNHQYGKNGGDKWMLTSDSQAKEISTPILIYEEIPKIRSVLRAISSKTLLAQYLLLEKALGTTV